MPKIVIIHQSGPRKGEREIFPTSRYSSVFLGRSEDCDVTVEDPERVVSRTHALIEWEEGSDSPLTITDLASSNGTLVNGERTDGVLPLNNGDAIQLGARLGPVLRVALVRPQEEEQEDAEASLETRHSTIPEARDLQREEQRAERPAKGTRVFQVDQDD